MLQKGNASCSAPSPLTLARLRPVACGYLCRHHRSLRTRCLCSTACQEHARCDQTKYLLLSRCAAPAGHQHGPFMSTGPFQSSYTSMMMPFARRALRMTPPSRPAAAAACGPMALQAPAGRRVRGAVMRSTCASGLFGTDVQCTDSLLSMMAHSCLHAACRCWTCPGMGWEAAFAQRLP